MPESLKPSLYDLTIKVYLGTNETFQEKAFTYEGNMIINFVCLKATNKIIFHMSELNINQSALKLESESGGGSTNLRILNTQYEEEREFYTVNLNDNCIANNAYRLSIEYTGDIRLDLTAFYLSSYINQQGERI